MCLRVVVCVCVVVRVFFFVHVLCAVCDVLCDVVCVGLSLLCWLCVCSYGVLLIRMWLCGFDCGVLSDAVCIVFCDACVFVRD